MRLNEEGHDGPAWMVRPLPARLTAREASKVLGFSENEVRHLCNQGHLKVIGSPNEKQTKWIATAYLAAIVMNENWLKRATELCYALNSRPNHKQRRLAA